MNKAILIIIVVTLAVSVVFAADLVITIPPSDLSDVAAAFGARLGLGRPANMQEVQASVKQDIINITKTYQRTTYTPPPLAMEGSPTPTPTPGLLKK